MKDYKKDQAKTRAFLRAWNLIKGYQFNAFPNRARRRAAGKGGYTTTNNVQTYIKPKEPK